MFRFKYEVKGLDGTVVKTIDVTVPEGKTREELQKHFDGFLKTCGYVEQLQLLHNLRRRD